MKISYKTRIATKPDGTQIPVVDGRYDFLVQPSEEDRKNGDPANHALCMYALCCKRLYESELVWVLRDVAFVELRGKGGRPELQRFILTPPARAEIKDFDASLPVTREAVIFAAPKGSRRLDAQAAKYRKWIERKKLGKVRKAHVKGTKPRDRSIKKFADAFLRDPGSGMFQFHRK